jgi:polyisoprenoid-binding protein YceI
MEVSRMRRKQFCLMMFGIIACGVLAWNTISITQLSLPEARFLAAAVEGGEIQNISETMPDGTPADNAATVRYQLDASQSTFIIDAKATGLLWFLGHPHHVAAKDFEGEVELTPETIQPVSLQIRVRTESLAETGEWFTEQQRQIITGTIHKEVLETAKYPEAVLKSTNVTVKKMGENQYEAKLEGDLTLHGVTRHLVIPAKVSVNGNTMQASGKFEFDRDDFNVKTHSIKGGTIRVDDDMKVSFTIVGHRR